MKAAEIAPNPALLCGLSTSVVRGVLASKPAGLKPTDDILPGCIPAGQTIKLNRPALRATYAPSAHRMLADNPAHPEG